jgi:hypothetical protein
LAAYTKFVYAAKPVGAGLPAIAVVQTPPMLTLTPFLASQLPQESHFNFFDWASIRPTIT